MAFQYAVKFVCGSTGSGILARGRYFTAINVHNPRDEEPIHFYKKFALVGEEPEQQGKVTEWFDAYLDPDHALEIDCRDIFDHTNAITGAPFRTGFVVIRSDEFELDVVAVYTVEGLFGRVKSLDVERVPPREV